MENLIKFLEDKITDKMSVEEIVDVFEQMCSTPLEEDMVLFETGTFTAFSKEPFFQISLVRQFSNDDEEFYQIHVVILYKPTAENKIFSETTWDEDLDENIFDYIRKSASFVLNPLLNKVSFRPLLTRWVLECYGYHNTVPF